MGNLYYCLCSELVTDPIPHLNVTMTTERRQAAFTHRLKLYMGVFHVKRHP
jgi:hypothetical protein